MGQIKTLYEFLDKKAPRPKGTLNVFDVDDTLFRSKMNVLVRDQLGNTKKLKTHQYNNYKLKTGEVHDFSQFRSSDLFYKKAKPIDKMIETARKVIASQDNNSRSIIMTARQDFDNIGVVLKKFREHGFPIDAVPIDLAGNLYKHLPGLGSNIYKGVAIKKYLKDGKYDKMNVWDDDKKNLDTFVKVASTFGVKTTAYLVNPKTGDTQIYFSGIK